MAEKHILMVIAPSDFRDEEFFEPFNYFTQDKHWQVTVASTATGTSKGMLGQTWDVKDVLDQQQADSFDALVIVGGMGSPTHLWDNADLHRLVVDFNRQRKVVSAICLSGVVLAKAGILENKQATVWEMPESLAIFEEHHVRYQKQDVVTDGNIVTSNGPHAATAFAHEIANQLSKVTTA